MKAGDLFSKEDKRYQKPFITSFGSIGKLLGWGLNWWWRTWWRAVAGHGQIACTCAPCLTRRGGPKVEPPWAPIKASHWRENISQTQTASWEEVLYCQKTPSPAGWVLSFLYVTVGLPASSLPGITKNLSEASLVLCENRKTILRASFFFPLLYFCQKKRRQWASLSPSSLPKFTQKGSLLGTHNSAIFYFSSH